MNKKCNQCKQLLPTKLFSRDSQLKSGLRGKCRVCISKNNHDPSVRRQLTLNAKRWKLNHREKAINSRNCYKKKNRSKISAHDAVYYALKVGNLIKPEFCSDCGFRKVAHGHHEDYSKKLDVKWLCHICHFKNHGKLKTIKDFEAQRD